MSVWTQQSLISHRLSDFVHPSFLWAVSSVTLILILSPNSWKALWWWKSTALKQNHLFSSDDDDSIYVPEIIQKRGRLKKQKCSIIWRSERHIRSDVCCLGCWEQNDVQLTETKSINPQLRISQDGRGRSSCLWTPTCKTVPCLGFASLLQLLSLWVSFTCSAANQKNTCAS